MPYYVLFTLNHSSTGQQATDLDPGAPWCGTTQVSTSNLIFVMVYHPYFVEALVVLVKVAIAENIQPTMDQL